MGVGIIQQDSLRRPQIAIIFNEIFSGRQPPAHPEVPEMSDNLHILTRLSTRENFIEFRHHASFKTYHFVVYSKGGSRVDDCKDRSCGVVGRRVVTHGYIILSV